MLAAYGASALLLEHPFYATAFVAQTVFMIAALLGVRAPWRRRVGVLIAAPYYFCMVNAAGVIALHRVVRRNGHAAPRLEDRNRDVAAPRAA
jgi:hypothetical protein